MFKRLKNYFVKFKLFKYIYLGKTISKSARTIYIEQGSPSLPSQIQRIQLYAKSQIVSTQGFNTDIPKQHLFIERWLYRGSQVILDVKRGDVYLNPHIRIYESSNWHPLLPEYSRTSVPNISIDTIEATDTVFLAGWTYFHFLVENLPAFLASNSCVKNPVCLIAVNSQTYVREALDLLGVEPRIVSNYVKISSLVFCGKGVDTGWLHPNDLDILRSSFRNYFREKKNKAIYISRSKSSRSPKNETELELKLQKLGVEIVYAEKLNFREQIQLFSEAHAIIGVHGAGLANQVWMEKKSKVFEIIDSNYFNICFESLASVCGHLYESYIYNSSINDGHIPVDDILEKFSQLLNQSY